MKKFDFRLEGLLRLRENKEQTIKVELGKILSEISDLEERIEEINKEIGEAYEAQDEIMAHSPSSGQFLQFFPYFIQNKKSDIENKETLIFSLKRRYEKKLEEMKVARGETKVIDNIKEKEREKFKKKVQKEENEKIEELFMIRNFNKKNSGY